MLPCSCEEGANEMINVLGDCVYGQRNTIGYWLGYLSIGAWLCCQAPQFISNWRRGSAEALSVVFVVEWLSGDACNLAGSILTHQLPTQVYVPRRALPLPVRVYARLGLVQGPRKLP